MVVYYKLSIFSDKPTDTSQATSATYILDSYSEVRTSSNELQNVQVGTSSQQAETTDDTIVVPRVQLSSLSYSKKIYEPCFVEFELSCTYGGNNSMKSNLDNLVESLSESAIELAIENQIIAKNYYITELEPRLQGWSRVINIRAKAYSLDRYLDTNMHSCAYSGKTAKEIFTAALSTFPCFNIKDRTNSLCANLCNLNRIDADDKAVALKIPYAVQYNESTYSFLSRFAARYGEYLYHESGVLNFGLQVIDTPITIDYYDEITFSNQLGRSTSEYVNNNYISGVSKHSPSTIVTASGTAPSTTNIVYSESSMDEAFAPYGLKKGDEFCNIDDFVIPTPMLCGAATAALGATDWISMGAKFGVKVADSYLVGLGTKRVYNKMYSEHTDDVTLINYSDDQIYVDYKYLSDIKQGMSDTLSTKITIDIRSVEEYKILLGTVINLLVGQSTSTDNKIINEYKEYLVVGVESINSSVKDISMRIEAVEYFATNVYAPVKVDDIRKSEPQSAVVVDNMDPQRMMRVRVCYNWQSEIYSGADRNLKTDLASASPWIRVATPSTAGGTGFAFLPEIGENVVIDYENGNIDRPYVSASMRSATQACFGTVHGDNLKVISSRFGQKIKLYDGDNDGDFFAKMVPVFGFITKYLPTSSWSKFDESENGSMGLDGYVELTDQNGIYSVKMSTTDRRVSIASPYGDVAISAFTGITLSAPNGNINIEGKNINITAGNNLNIVSGKNIEAYKSDQYSSAGVIASNIAMTTVKTILGEGALIDIPLLRSLIEALIKPVGGKLIIKSNRFLHLVSGGSDVEEKDFDANGNPNSWAERDRVYQVIRFISNYINAANNSYSRNKLAENNAKTAYSRLRDEVNGTLSQLKDALSNVRVQSETDPDKLEEYNFKNSSSLDNFTSKFPLSTAINASSEFISFTTNTNLFSNDDLAVLRDQNLANARSVNTLVFQYNEVVKLCKIRAYGPIKAFEDAGIVIVANTNTKGRIKTFLSIPNYVERLVDIPLINNQVANIGETDAELPTLLSDAITEQDNRDAKRIILLLAIKDVISNCKSYIGSEIDPRYTNKNLSIDLISDATMKSSIATIMAQTYDDSKSDTWDKVITALAGGILKVDDETPLWERLIDKFVVDTKTLARFGKDTAATARKAIELPDGELLISNKANQTIRLNGNNFVVSHTGGEFQTGLATLLRQLAP